jgi:hypothetical protein
MIMGFVFASGCGQRVHMFGESQSSYLRSSDRAVGSDTAKTGVFTAANSRAIARSMLLDMLARDRDVRDGKIFRNTLVWRLAKREAFFFVSGMTIDADGAPNAYNSDDTGLDDVTNAGGPNRWNGVVTDGSGNPLIQQQSDPFPGYYISCTSLSDKTKKFDDPTGYVDASKIPYVALPKDVADWGGARLGDFAVVTNLRNGKSSFAIYADIGTLGEGSVALAEALGIRSNARNGGESDGILYLLFSGSGNLRPRTTREIQSGGEELLHNHWNGIKELSPCVRNEDPAFGGGNHCLDL